jgi:hypothetical protein
MMIVLPAHPEKIISFWQRQLMTVFGQPVQFVQQGARPGLD